ncbi:MAG: cytochrome c oxidase accessory protein CcoG [Chitinophagaceae bacterium]|nr:cytochrome c oxidase accessory protein CcoG [Chitinophagaceae bacterium]
MSAIIDPDRQNFRDTITTVEEDGSRKWIFAKKPKGFYYSLRSFLSWFYLLVFFGLPWLKYEGESLFMLNVIKRKFIIFGLHFGVQDLIVFGIAMLTMVVFIVLFTVVFGRLFCGWACPQTIFMEMVFRKVEYLIDGDAQQQRSLAKAPWDAAKIFKRVLKYVLFYLIALAISHTFLAYIIGIDEVRLIMTEPLTKHIVGFFAMVIFSFAFFVVYAFFREQICIIACPYGRLQGVLLDKNSIVVAYDYQRGEPRGKMLKDNPSAQGDCIDCKACVHVCPTGIDIRNGTQLECVNCTACIDACDDIMKKIQKPLGLIRYASENNISKGVKTNWFSSRIIAYSVVLVILLGLLTFTFLSHSSIDASVLRTPGQFYQENTDGTISNLYNFNVSNKKNQPLKLEFKMLNLDATIRMIGNPDITIPGEEEKRGQFFVILPKGKAPASKTTLEIGIYGNGELLKKQSTTFMAPVE